MSKKRKFDGKQYDKIAHKVRNYISKQEIFKNNSNKIDLYNNDIGNLSADDKQVISFNSLIQQFSSLILKINFNTQKDIKELLNTIVNNIVLKYDLNKLEQNLKEYPEEVTKPLYQSIVNCNLIDSKKTYKKNNKRNNFKPTSTSTSKQDNYMSEEEEEEEEEEENEDEEYDEDDL